MSTVKISSNNEIIIFPCHPADQISTDRSLRMRLPVVRGYYTTAVPTCRSRKSCLRNGKSGTKDRSRRVASLVCKSLAAWLLHVRVHESS